MDSNNLTKSGAITPVVDFRHLQEVLVIKELKDVSQAQDSIATQGEQAAEEESAAQDEETETQESDTQMGESDGTAQSESQND